MSPFASTIKGSRPTADGAIVARRPYNRSSFGRSLLKPHILFISPAVLYVVVVSIYPLLYGVYISFTDLRYDTPGMSFVGLQNYLRMIRWDALGTVVANSFIFVFGSVALSFVGGLVVATALNKVRVGRLFFRAISIMPWVLPAVVVGVLFAVMFDSSKLGLLNSIVAQLGARQVSWLVHPFVAMAAIILAFSWRTIAFATVMFLAALQVIPDDLIETAKIEGANSFQTFTRVILPLILPQITIVVIMISVAALNQIDVVLSVTGGGPGRATETLALAVYRESFQLFRASFGATLAVMLLLLNVALATLYYQILKMRGEVTFG